MTDARNDIVRTAKSFVLLKSLGGKLRMHWAEVRPMPLTTKFPIITDCSGEFTLNFWIAGANDPNKRRFDGYGNTVTLFNAGLHLDISQVVPGDAVIYGPGGEWHVGTVVEVHGHDILTVSHGQEGDPSYVWVNPPKTVPHRGYPSDGRMPQTYVRFPTRRISPLREMWHAVAKKVAPKASPGPQPPHPPTGYQRPGPAPAGGVQP